MNIVRFLAISASLLLPVSSNSVLNAALTVKNETGAPLTVIMTTSPIPTENREIVLSDALDSSFTPGGTSMLFHGQVAPESEGSSTTGTLLRGKTVTFPQKADRNPLSRTTTVERPLRNPDQVARYTLPPSTNQEVVITNYNFLMPDERDDLKRSLAEQLAFPGRIINRLSEPIRIFFADPKNPQKKLFIDVLPESATKFPHQKTIFDRIITHSNQPVDITALPTGPLVPTDGLTALTISAAPRYRDFTGGWIPLKNPPPVALYSRQLPQNSVTNAVRALTAGVRVTNARNEPVRVELPGAFPELPTIVTTLPPWNPTGSADEPTGVAPLVHEDRVNAFNSGWYSALAHDGKAIYPVKRPEDSIHTAEGVERVVEVNIT